MEKHFRRAMLSSNGDVFVFFERPISAGIMTATVALLAWGLWTSLRPSYRLADLPVE